MLDGKRCVGVKAVDGTEWPADLVVFAAGAWSPALIDLQGQCTSKVSGPSRSAIRVLTGAQCWVYAHIQLTPEEAEAWKGIPTMYNDQLVRSNHSSQYSS